MARYNPDGSLDPSFGNDGKVTTSIANYAPDVCVQVDGKILIASSTGMVRYNSNGSLDNNFGTGGILTIKDFGSSYPTVTQQSDRKILLSNTDGTIRFDENGSIDTTFGNQGQVNKPTGGRSLSSNVVTSYDVALQTDGKILVSGKIGSDNTQDIALVRYNTDGSSDIGFGTNGRVITDFAMYDYGYSVAVQADGKILVGGGTNVNPSPSFILARYNVDGSLDKSFDSDGKVTTSFGGSYDYGTSLAVQVNGKILLAGFSGTGSYNALALARYNADGSLDTSFDGDGKVTTPVYATFTNQDKASIAIQSDGKILVSGYSNFGATDDFVLVRYNADGSLDTGKLVGTAGNDQLAGDVGAIDGLAGIDTVSYSGNRGSIAHNSNGTWTVGTDTLTNIERLQFADKKIALDLTPEGNAGKAHEFIGMMAHNLVNMPTVVGTILSIFDQGKSMKEVCQLAIDVGLTGNLAGSTSNLDLAKLVFRNVVGSEASAETANGLAGFIQGSGGSMSQADFLTAVAQLDLNNQHIGLVGLQQTGIEYII